MHASSRNGLAHGSALCDSNEDDHRRTNNHHQNRFSAWPWAESLSTSGRTGSPGRRTETRRCQLQRSTSQTGNSMVPARPVLFANHWILLSNAAPCPSLHSIGYDFPGASRPPSSSSSPTVDFTHLLSLVPTKTGSSTRHRLGSFGRLSRSVTLYQRTSEGYFIAQSQARG